MLIWEYFALLLTAIYIYTYIMFVSFLDKKVILYRIGDHIDISRGPMIGNTDLLGRCTIAAVCL